MQKYKCKYCKIGISKVQHKSHNGLCGACWAQGDNTFKPIWNRVFKKRKGV